MMLISHSCQVALRSVAYIASVGGGSINAKQLSVHIGESPHTITKVLQLLVKAGALSSITGPGGGFFLSPKQQQRALIDIVNLVDGKAHLKRCVLGLKKCTSSHPCPMHNGFVPARNHIYRMLKETSIESILPALRRGKYFLS